MAVPVKNVSAPGYGEDTYVKTDTRAMSVATALFFMVGFLTCLNDVISPHLKSIFALDYSQLQNVPFYFFSSYFVFSYPSGKLVERFGYKKTMVVGLLVMAARRHRLPARRALRQVLASSSPRRSSSPPA